MQISEGGCISSWCVGLVSVCLWLSIGIKSVFQSAQQADEWTILFRGKYLPQDK